MPGPMSVPNGDTTIVRGHVNEVFMCDKHNKQYDEKSHQESYDKDGLLLCRMVSLREYLAKRNRLVTGKTR
jgi:hypothetical protein